MISRFLFLFLVGTSFSQLSFVGQKPQTENVDGVAAVVGVVVLLVERRRHRRYCY